MSEQIAIVPAPRELVRADGYWHAADPVAEAVRTVVDNLPEADYRVDVTPEGARLSGGSEDALRHAEQTFRQLVSSAGDDGVPCVRIADAPAFGWRGVMLDVARHFMPKDFILRLVDALEHPVHTTEPKRSFLLSACRAGRLRADRSALAD